MKYHYISISMALIQKKERKKKIINLTIPSSGKDDVQLGPSNIVIRRQNDMTTWEDSSVLSYEVKHTLSYDPAIPSLGICFSKRKFLQEKWYDTSKYKLICEHF